MSSSSFLSRDLESLKSNNMASVKTSGIIKIRPSFIYFRSCVNIKITFSLQIIQGYALLIKKSACFIPKVSVYQKKVRQTSSKQKPESSFGNLPIKHTCLKFTTIKSKETARPFSNFHFFYSKLGKKDECRMIIIIIIFYAKYIQFSLWTVCI